MPSPPLSPFQSALFPQNILSSDSLHHISLVYICILSKLGLLLELTGGKAVLFVHLLLTSCPSGLAWKSPSFSCLSSSRSSIRSSLVSLLSPAHRPFANPSPSKISSSQMRFAPFIMLLIFFLHSIYLISLQKLNEQLDSLGIDLPFRIVRLFVARLQFDLGVLLGYKDSSSSSSSPSPSPPLSSGSFLQNLIAPIFSPSQPRASSSPSPPPSSLSPPQLSNLSSVIISGVEIVIAPRHKSSSKKADSAGDPLTVTAFPLPIPPRFLLFSSNLP